MFSGASCSLSCATGYSLDSATTSCSFGQLTQQHCLPSNCSGASLPSNSLVNTCTQLQSGLVSGAACQLSCAAGYTLSGSATSCLRGVLTLQSCSPSPCTVTAPINGNLNLCSSTLADSSSCQMSCAQGYTLLGASTSCSLGQLTAQSCNASACISSSLSPFLSNAVAAGTCSTPLASGAGCRLACASGYRQAGTGAGDLFCSLGTLASVTSISCLAPCSLTLPADTLAGDCTDTLTDSASCTLVAQSGFSVVSGSLLISCSNGTLSTLPVMQGQLCNR